ncbi:MAG: hypothetical protein K9L02_00765 [Acholeplasmataceae bacterium]|nr:hypothetical protein [Acholeplasmataceae bacterium]
MPDQLALAFIVIAFLIFLIVGLNFKIAREHEAHVVERIGQFYKIVKGPGIFFNIPLLDRVVQVVPLKPLEKNIKLENHETGVAHNLHLRYQIKDIKLFVYSTLDAEKSLKDYISNNLSIENQFTKTDENLIQDYAEILGIEILEMLYK